MVETKDLEVIAVQKEYITKEFLQEFVNSTFKYLVLLDQEGCYMGIMGMDILKRNGQWMTDKLVLDKRVYLKASITHLNYQSI